MDNNEALIYYNKGYKYNNEGKYQLAITNFLKALELSPEYTNAYFDIGAAYIGSKQYDLAIEAFNNVLKRNPEEIHAYSNIALAYLKRGNAPESIANYKKILALKPDCMDTRMDLAYAYIKNHQYDEAITIYKEAMKHSAYIFKAKEGLNTALNLKNFQEQNNPPAKIENIQVQAPPSEKPDKTSDQYFDIAVNFLKVNYIDLAIENLRHCLKLNPSHTRASVLLDKLFKLKQS